MPRALAPQDGDTQLTTCSFSPQNRSVQPEFQDRQAHASCVQRVGHQTPLALESSDIQPALQKRALGSWSRPCSHHCAFFSPAQGHREGPGSLLQDPGTWGHSAAGPPPTQARALAFPTPEVRGLWGAGWGLEVGAVSGHQQGLGLFLPVLSPGPVSSPSRLSAFSSLVFISLFSSASTAGRQPPHRVDSAKPSLSAFPYQLGWASHVPPAQP